MKAISSGPDVEALQAAAEAFTQAVRHFHETVDPKPDDRTQESHDAGLVMQAVVAVASRLNVPPGVFFLGVGAGLGSLLVQASGHKADNQVHLLGALSSGMKQGAGTALDHLEMESIHQGSVQ